MTQSETPASVAVLEDELQKGIEGEVDDDTEEFENVAAMLVEKRVEPRFSNPNHRPTLEREQNRFADDTTLFERYVSQTIRHSLGCILPFRLKEIADLERFLQRNFQAEFEQVRTSAAARAYINTVSKYSPADRAARLREVEDSGQELLKNPTERILNRYRQALQEPPSQAERTVFAARAAMGLSDESFQTDISIIQEFRTLQKELADENLEQRQSEYATLLNEISNVKTELLANGVQPQVSESYQRLFHKLTGAEKAVSELREKLSRFAELSTFEIIRPLIDGCVSR